MTANHGAFFKGGGYSDEDYSNIMDYGRFTEKWIMLATPVPVVAILTAYLVFVLKVGPAFMKDRKPYDLKNIMRLYNLAQVLVNLLVVYMCLIPINGHVPLKYGLEVSCHLPEYFPGLEDLKFMYLKVGWVVLLIKTLDLLDTVFMVLRKKNSHVTFLHVYHHSAMVFLMWFTLKYIKNVQGSIPVFINVNVHAVMYSYYFLATFPSFKQYLWWKQYLTKLQLTQFVIVLAYLGILYYNQCDISPRFTFIWAFNTFVILCLFLNFYVKTYIQDGALYNIKFEKKGV